MKKNTTKSNKLSPAIFVKAAVEVDLSTYRDIYFPKNRNVSRRPTHYCCNALQYVMDKKSSLRYAAILTKYFKPKYFEIEAELKNGVYDIYSDYIENRGFWGQGNEDTNSARIIALLICAEIVKEQNRKKR